mmetsp:Transcript_34034/g.81080  ORF Transcript_34034/g.81080 Transcript_34034/m.81080 type:complete len:271 (+) Transcript_34034:3405-4217(+)
MHDALYSVFVSSLSCACTGWVCLMPGQRYGDIDDLAWQWVTSMVHFVQTAEKNEKQQLFPMQHLTKFEHRPLVLYYLMTGHHQHSRGWRTLLDGILTANNMGSTHTSSGLRNRRASVFSEGSIAAAEHCNCVTLAQQCRASPNGQLSQPLAAAPVAGNAQHHSPQASPTAQQGANGRLLELELNLAPLPANSEGGGSPGALRFKEVVFEDPDRLGAAEQVDMQAPNEAQSPTRASLRTNTNQGNPEEWVRITNEGNSEEWATHAHRGNVA